MTTPCSRCGTDASAGDEVCRACGAPLAAAPPAPDLAVTAPRASVVQPAASSAPAVGYAPSPSQDAAPAAPRVATAAPVAAAGSQPAASYPYAPRWPQQSTVGYGPAYGAYPLSPLYYPYAWPAAPYAPAAYMPVGYSPYLYYPPKPRPAPGNGYRLFLGWFVTIGGGLTVLFGLFFTLIMAIAVVTGDAGLDAIGSAIGITIVPIVGGAVCIYLGIRSLLRHPSPRFTMPPWWLLAAITLAAMAGEIVIWNASNVPGNVWAVLPLFTLCGLLPVLTILAFANRRLANPSTWRHVLVSMTYGAAVATFIAGLLNLLAYALVVVVLNSLGYQITFNANFIQSLNPTDPTQALVFLLVGSVGAPLIEETLKPIAAIVAIPRLRSAGEAFLLGLSAGVGFAFVETLQYFGLGQADWISVAIERLGAGLLHGVGAGMTAMGWYLLIRGRGVPKRWLKGFGAILYAILQHAIFNGSNLLDGIPAINQLSQNSIELGHLPISAGLAIVFIIYALIIAVLVIVTGRLRKGVLLADREPDAPVSAPAQPAPVAAQGGAR